MRLLTAIVATELAPRVTAALDSAGLMATTVTTAEAPGMRGSSRWHQGAEYRDRQCLRLEILVSDVDAEIAFGLLRPPHGPAADGMIVWCSEVDDLAAPPPRFEASELSRA